MLWLIPLLLVAMGVGLSLYAVWIIAPSVPGLRTLRARVALSGQRFVQEWRDDPPPLAVWLVSALQELADEWGPQLQSSTNRNAILGAATGYAALFLPMVPIPVIQQGVGYAIAALLVFYMLRTMAGRKRAAGPILTPRDIPVIGPRHDADSLAILNPENATISVNGEIQLRPEPVAEYVVAPPSPPRRARKARKPAKKTAKKPAAKKPRKRA